MLYSTVVPCGLLAELVSSEINKICRECIEKVVDDDDDNICLVGRILAHDGFGVPKVVYGCVWHLFVPIRILIFCVDPRFYG